MKKQNQINNTTKISESEEIIKDIADFETLLEKNRNDRNSHKVSILEVATLWKFQIGTNLQFKTFCYENE